MADGSREVDDSGFVSLLPQTTRAFPRGEGMPRRARGSLLFLHSGISVDGGDHKGVSCVQGPSLPAELSPTLPTYADFGSIP